MVICYCLVCFLCACLYLFVPLWVHLGMLCSEFLVSSGISLLLLFLRAELLRLYTAPGIHTFGILYSLALSSLYRWRSRAQPAVCTCSFHDVFHGLLETVGVFSRVVTVICAN